jgi:hypothetical protein
MKNEMFTDMHKLLMDIMFVTGATEFDDLSLGDKKNVLLLYLKSSDFDAYVHFVENIQIEHMIIDVLENNASSDNLFNEILNEILKSITKEIDGEMEFLNCIVGNYNYDDEIEYMKYKDNHL